MQMSNVIVYDPETIRHIGSNITAILDQQIIDSLMEIKINNRFIRRRSPIKLKYTMNKQVATAWRNQKETGEGIEEEDKFTEEINTELNKLSESNYEIIKDVIKGICDSYTNDKYRNLLLEILFNKSINESTYSFLYAKLVNMLIEVYGIEFKEMILQKMKTFYTENIDKKFNTSDPEIDYDKLCALNKEKSKLLGSFTFIGGLYANNIIECDVVTKYFNILVETILNVEISEQETLDKYVECLSTLLKSIGAKLEAELEDRFQEKVMDNLRAIVNNKSKFKPRTRFMVMDIIDLRKKGW